MKRPTPSQRANAMLLRWQDRNKAIALANENLNLANKAANPDAKAFWKAVIKELEQ